MFLVLPTTPPLWTQQLQDFSSSDPLCCKSHRRDRLHWLRSAHTDVPAALVVFVPVPTSRRRIFQHCTALWTGQFYGVNLIKFSEPCRPGPATRLVEPPRVALGGLVSCETGTDAPARPPLGSGDDVSALGLGPLTGRNKARDVSVIGQPIVDGHVTLAGEDHVTGLAESHVIVAHEWGLVTRFLQDALGLSEDEAQAIGRSLRWGRSGFKQANSHTRDGVHVLDHVTGMVKSLLDTCGSPESVRLGIKARPGLLKVPKGEMDAKLAYLTQLGFEPADFAALFRQSAAVLVMELQKIEQLATVLRSVSANPVHGIRSAALSVSPARLEQRLAGLRRGSGLHSDLDSDSDPGPDAPTRGPVPVGLVVRDEGLIGPCDRRAGTGNVDDGPEGDTGSGSGSGSGSESEWPERGVTSEDGGDGGGGGGVVEVMAEYGFTEAQVAKILRRAPAALKLREELIRSKFELLLGLGMSKGQLAQLIALRPTTCCMSLVELRRKLEFFESMGLVKAAVARVCRRSSVLVSNLDTTIKPRCEDLRHLLGMSESEVQLTISRSPDVLVTSAAKFRDVLATLRFHGVDGPHLRKLVMSSQSLFSLSPAVIGGRIDSLRSYGFGSDALVRLISSFPSVLALSFESCSKPKLDAILSYGYILDDILKFPAILGYSLLNRIHPRLAFLAECLLVPTGTGHPAGPVSLSVALVPTDDVFARSVCHRSLAEYDAFRLKLVDPASESRPPGSSR